MTESEQEFLKNYRLDDYPRPSVTTDVAAFMIHSENAEHYKREPSSKLSILLIKRGGHPYKGYWALPGGFLSPSETIEECALRETKEETGLVPVALLPVGIFSTPGRDQRGWIISSAYASVLCSSDINVAGGDDAEDAKWFDVSLEKHDEEYAMRLKNGDSVVTARLKEKSSLFGKVDFEILESDSLAFDHAKIIATAIMTLRNAPNAFDLAMDFLPETFTLSEFQRVHEAVTGISQQAMNFRQKIDRYVEKTDEYRTGSGHRPAMLYQRKRRENNE